MKTKLLIIIAIVAVFVISYATIFELYDDVLYFFTITVYDKLQNNPIHHNIIISDIKNTDEYMTFSSRFAIYDEGIISTVGNSFEYKVTAKNNKTENMVILDFKHYTHAGKLSPNVRCSVVSNSEIIHIFPPEPDRNIVKFIENTDCLDDDYVYSDTVSVVHVETDKQEYQTNDVIVIFGHVDGRMPDASLIITIHNPLLDVVYISQVTLSDDDTFEKTLPIGGPLWKQNGIYLVSAQYGKATDQKEFWYLSDLKLDDLLQEIKK